MEPWAFGGEISIEIEGVNNDLSMHGQTLFNFRNHDHDNTVRCCNDNRGLVPGEAGVYFNVLGGKVERGGLGGGKYVGNEFEIKERATFSSRRTKFENHVPFHLIITINHKLICFYKNGELSDTHEVETATAEPMRTLREVHRIGGEQKEDGAEKNFCGIIGRFRMWNKRCLSRREVEKIWEDRKYHMDEYNTKIKPTKQRTKSK
ncbi:hypothetical protein TrST_g11780 [Triparma strigata]|uniref:Uncharacterized protein n=1 Tax=Triparma strigata TaxID=1606541 RepID=A0A9W7AYI0_9STRA|nr:hypothetical protein TrST_g11780 [Triparma strigata]